MKITDTYVFFWKEFLSQWAVSPFEHKGVKFKTAEHYMMYNKAILFKDLKTAELILKAGHPRDVKDLGRKVAKFDIAYWDDAKFDIVCQGNFLKFLQNKNLLEKLVDKKFYNKCFVEASPFDKVWGIGLSEDDPRVESEETWQGENLLGEALTVVRDSILAGEADYDVYENDEYLKRFEL